MQKAKVSKPDIVWGMGLLSILSLFITRIFIQTEKHKKLK